MRGKGRNRQEKEKVGGKWEVEPKLHLPSPLNVIKEMSGYTNAREKRVRVLYFMISVGPLCCLEFRGKVET